MQINTLVARAIQMHHEDAHYLRAYPQLAVRPAALEGTFYVSFQQGYHPTLEEAAALVKRMKLDSCLLPVTDDMSLDGLTAFIARLEKGIATATSAQTGVNTPLHIPLFPTLEDCRFYIPDDTGIVCLPHGEGDGFVLAYTRFPILNNLVYTVNLLRSVSDPVLRAYGDMLTKIANELATEL